MNIFLTGGADIFGSATTNTLHDITCAKSLNRPVIGIKTFTLIKV